MNQLQHDNLADTLAQYGFALPGEQIDLLDRYCRLLWSWNEKLNLTRHTDYDKFVSRDVLDAMQLSALLHDGEEVLDIGSGGGAPAIVLAIVRPDLKMSYSESVGKKAQVLETIVGELDLSSAVYHDRAEKVLEDFRFDAVTARAVGPLWKICTWLAPHWASVGRLLAVKGPRWVDERNEARHRGLLNNLQLRRAAIYPMPGAESDSVILKIWHKGAPDR